MRAAARQRSRPSSAHAARRTAFVLLTAGARRSGRWRGAQGRHVFDTVVAVTDDGIPVLVNERRAQDTLGADNSATANASAGGGDLTGVTPSSRWDAAPALIQHPASAPPEAAARADATCSRIGRPPPAEPARHKTRGSPPPPSAPRTSFSRTSTRCRRCRATTPAGRAEHARRARRKRRAQRRARRALQRRRAAVGRRRPHRESSRDARRWLRHHHRFRCTLLPARDVPGARRHDTRARGAQRVRRARLLASPLSRGRNR